MMTWITFIQIVNICFAYMVTIMKFFSNSQQLNCISFWAHWKQFKDVIRKRCVYTNLKYFIYLFNNRKNEREKNHVMDLWSLVNWIKAAPIIPKDRQCIDIANTPEQFERHIDPSSTGAALFMHELWTGNHSLLHGTSAEAITFIWLYFIESHDSLNTQ